MGHDLANPADRQWCEYRAGTPGTVFADPKLSLDLAKTYELQDAGYPLRIAAGERVVGYKVGCTGPGTIEQFGTTGPIRGNLFASEMRQSERDACVGVICEPRDRGEMALRVGDGGKPEAAFPFIEPRWRTMVSGDAFPPSGLGSAWP